MGAGGGRLQVLGLSRPATVARRRYAAQCLQALPCSRQRSMKILPVIPSLARGGGERLMIELANREIAAGHEVTVLAAYPVPVDEAHGGLSKAVRLRYVAQLPARGLRGYRRLLPWMRMNRGWLEEQD